MSMSDWIKKLDGFLSLNDRDILDHAGKVSYQMAKHLAEQGYDSFHQQRLQNEARQADKRLEQLSKLAEQLRKPEKINKGKQKP